MATTKKKPAAVKCAKRTTAPSIACKHHAQYTDGVQVPAVIVLHSTESDGKGAPYCGAIFGYLDREKLSVHWCVARDGAIGHAADADQVCRHAPPNHGKVGIEQAGFARFTRAEWMQRKDELAATARVIAWLCWKHGIPITRSTTSGVCQHSDLPQGGHHDCGPGYPIDYVLKTALAYRNATYGPRGGGK